jgi:hypothetical protein
MHPLQNTYCVNPFDLKISVALFMSVFGSLYRCEHLAGLK